jgi:hypothetical protein
MTYQSIKDYLDKMIKDYLLIHKYIIYHNVIDYNEGTIDSNIFEDIDDDVYLEQNFNYYILIEKKYYKLLKNKIFIKNNHQYFDLPVIAKFYKSYYNKEDFTYNSIKYVKIKLRIFSNSSRMRFNLDIGTNFSNFGTNFPKILIMAVPIKKKYSNMFYLDESDYLDDYIPLSKKKSYKIKLSENLDLYIGNSYILSNVDEGNNTSKSKDKDIFDNMIDNFDDLVKNHHNILYDKDQYLKRMYSCILKNKKYGVELEVVISIYFRHPFILKKDEIFLSHLG